MGASFKRHSFGKFEKDTSIVSIFHGTDSFLLEDELNESQWIKIEQFASILREQYTNGFLKKFNVKIDIYDNIFYLEAIDTRPLTVIVDGYQIVVGGNKFEHVLSQENRLLVELPAAWSYDRKDLVFLEAWFEVLTSKDDLRKFGGEDTQKVSLRDIPGSSMGKGYNNFVDGRVKTETSRRVQMRWRIRTVPNGDFNTGITANKYDGTDSKIQYQLVDGIYVADVQEQKTIIGDVKSNGPVYAIPLFEVDRKANVNALTLTDIVNKFPQVSYRENVTLTDQIVSPERFQQDPNFRLVSDTEKERWNNTYTQNEVDSKISQVVTGLNWQKSVSTIEDLTPTYQDPEEGFTVTIDSTNETYRYDGTSWEKIDASIIPIATTSVDGKMSSEDKKKLDSIEFGANNYTHPEKHYPSEIVQDPNNRFVSDTNKLNWNDKYTRIEVDNKINSVVTNIRIDEVVEKSTDLSTIDKVDGKIVYINEDSSTYKYNVSNDTWAPVVSAQLNWQEQVQSTSDLETIPEPKENDVVYVAEENKAYKYTGSTWESIMSAPFNLVTYSVNGLMSSEDKKKLDELSNYVHPDFHSADEITETMERMFTTQTEKDKLASIEAGATADMTNAEIKTAYEANPDTNAFTDAEKTKLSSIAENANNYVHPANHPPSIITQDANNRFVTDTEKSTWNDKYTKSEVDNKINTVTSSLDWKESVATYADIATTYPSPVDGWTVNVKDTDITYRYSGTAWIAISANSIPLATQSVDGKMSSADKTKLDGIAANANNYVHPSTHPASIITQDAARRFVTDTEKATWNAKASTSVVTTTANGLMSLEDKTKLDGIATNANNYIHPATHPASIITQDANNRFVTDTEKATWNSKASTSVATTSANGLMSSTDKSKLDGIEAGATADMTNAEIKAAYEANSNTNVFTDAEKTKLTGIEAGATADMTDAEIKAAYEANLDTNAFTDAEKTKLAGIATNANNYTHPATHPASMIVQDSTRRFVTDTEKSTWNDKYTKSEVDSKISSATSNLDWKESVATYADIATTYPNPVEGWTVTVRDTDTIYRYSGNSWVAISANSIPLASTTVDGKMSSADKIKLDGIATNANNYVHPATHPASIITQDANNRFVTDTEKATWNSKANTSVATTTANGLMSSTDKSKLDGVAANANNYTHPATHPATMITEDSTHRFVTDTEKTNWNAKETPSGAQTKANTAEANAKNASIPKTEKGVANGVAALNASGQVIDASGNVVEGKVTSVNGKTGDLTVTKSDVGLGNVSDYGIATQVEAETGTSDAKYMTPLKAKQAIDKNLSPVQDKLTNRLPDNAVKIGIFTLKFNPVTNSLDFEVTP